MPAPYDPERVAADPVAQRLQVLLELDHVLAGLAGDQVPVGGHGPGECEERPLGHLQDDLALADVAAGAVEDLGHDLLDVLPGEPPALVPMSDGLTSRGGSTTAWASTAVLSTVRTTGVVSWVAAGGFVSAACWAAT